MRHDDKVGSVFIQAVWFCLLRSSHVDTNELRRRCKLGQIVFLDPAEGVFKQGMIVKDKHGVCARMHACVCECRCVHACVCLRLREGGVGSAVVQANQG